MFRDATDAGNSTWIGPSVVSVTFTPKPITYVQEATVSATIDGSMLVSGMGWDWITVGDGGIAIAWRVTRLVDGQIMASGVGSSCVFSFTATDYVWYSLEFESPYDVWGGPALFCPMPSVGQPPVPVPPPPCPPCIFYVPTPSGPIGPT